MINNYISYLSNKYVSKWLVLTIDLSIVLLTFCLSYFIRFNFTFNFKIENFFIQLPIMFFVAGISFFVFGTFRSAIRNTSFNDVMKVFKAIVLMSLLTVFFILVNNKVNIFSEFSVPKSIIAMHAILSFVALTSIRLLLKLIYNKLKYKDIGYKRVLIYGTGESSIVTYNTLINDSKTNFKIVAFIDQNIKESGKLINETSIISANKINQDYIDKNKINEIIVATDNIRKEILMNLVSLEVKVTKVPPVENWIDGRFDTNEIKLLQIEDLVGHAREQIDISNLLNEYKDETILVTGAAGSIGSELSRQLAELNVKHIILLDQSEFALYELQQELLKKGLNHFTPVVGDIRDGLRLDSIFQEFKPTMVFHAAAYKHVLFMEKYPYEAVKINVYGTKLLADTSSRYNIKKFVFVSTDKAANPTTVMGATKRIAEKYISCLQKESKTKFIITRFGNTLWSKSSIIPLFKKQIEMGGPLTLTHQDISRYFMTIPEAVQLVLETGAMGKGDEIFNFDMGETVNIFDLAKSMIKLSGLKYPNDIDINITGLRPGEKLYEQLPVHNESMLRTNHEKIMINKVNKFDYASVKSEIEELCITNRFQNKNIVLNMECLVSDYKSNSSDIELLDKKVQNYKKLKGISDLMSENSLSNIL